MMPQIAKLIAVLVMGIATASCGRAMLRRNIRMMYEREISFPADLVRINGVDGYHDDLSDSIPKLVVYIDSSECTSCRMSHFQDYEYLLEQTGEFHKFMLALIVTPSSDVRSSIEKQLRTRELPFDVFIDYDASFLSANNFIPDTRFHSFLTDAGNHPILIGDPTRGEKLRELFWSQLTK